LKHIFKGDGHMGLNRTFRAQVHFGFFTVNDLRHEDDGGIFLAFFAKHRASPLI
jgi:hypothetical protein